MATALLERMDPPPVAASQLAGRPRAAIVAGAIAFLALFAEPMATLVRDWWQDPEASHGLLLGPLAVWLAWRSGLVAVPRPSRLMGSVMLAGAVLLRVVSALAAELFTMRLSMLGAAAALVIFVYGWRQVVRWWLPLSLLILSVPLPTVILGTLALPLQLFASKIGAALLEWRHVPVHLAGHVIYLPGQALFVTEACSGLRSLTALISLGLLLGAFWLRSPWLRALLIVLSIPVAVLLNSIRVFLTGFAVYFISPEAGQGILHYSEGWAVFIVAFVALTGLATLLGALDRREPKEAA